MLNLIRRALGLFDSNGLNHDIDKLRSIKSEIGFFSITEQAKYADAVCKHNVKYDSFLRSQLSEIDINDTSQFRNVNTTAVGNMAYIAINSPSSDIREFCKSWLEKYKDYLNSFRK